MKKTKPEILLQFVDCADKLSFEIREYYNDYIITGKIIITSDQFKEFSKLATNRPQDDNAIQIQKDIIEERCRLLRKRKNDIEGELARLESKSKSDSIWAF